LSRCILAGVKARGAVVRPRFTFKRTEKTPGAGDFVVGETPFPNTHPSFLSYHIDQIANDLKESVCKVHDSIFEAGTTDIQAVSYELPDGQEILVGPDRSKVPEILFQPDLISAFPLLDVSHKVSAKPFHTLVLDSISQCDVDTRKELYAGVVLTGGSSLMPGLRDRLEKELGVLGPQAAKIKVSMPINTLERRFSVWLGGSILASLGSFQSLWMSKKEYEEYGSALIHRKAP
jgi:actin-like protein 6A